VSGRATLAIAAFFVLAFLLQCAAFVRSNAQTYDEALMLAAGVLFWRRSPTEVNGEHPPLAKALAALPVVLSESPRIDVDGFKAGHKSGFELGRAFMYEGGVPHRRLLALGRSPMVALAAALVALTGLWARRLFGPRAGLLALALAAFDPNLVAYGSVIGNDLPLALFSTLTLFATSEFFARARVRWVVLAGFAMGLALATKFTGVLLLPVLLVVFFTRAVVRGDVGAWPIRRSPGTVVPRASSLANAGVALAIVFALAAAVTCLVYVARGYGTRWYAAYVSGVRAQLEHQAGGHRAFFLGEVSSAGWASYFPVALAVKSPPLTLGLFAVSLVLLRRGAPLGPAMEATLLPLALLLAAVTRARVDIGVRYVLLVVPILVVLASRVATCPRRWDGGLRVALALGITHHVLAALRIAPHDLAFFSDVVGGPARGSLYLADSNLDWGQDLGTLAGWNARVRPDRLYLAYFGTAPPEAYGIMRYQPAPNACPHQSPWQRAAPVPGAGREFLAVSVMNEQGVFFRDPRSYAWLEQRARLTSLGHSIDVYEITQDADAHRALASLYRRYGPSEFEAGEIARAEAIESGDTRDLGPTPTSPPRIGR
jgi:hypothetical protein